MCPVVVKQQSLEGSRAEIITLRNETSFSNTICHVIHATSVSIFQDTVRSYTVVISIGVLFFLLGKTEKYIEIFLMNRNAGGSGYGMLKMIQMCFLIVQQWAQSSRRKLNISKLSASSKKRVINGSRHKYFSHQLCHFKPIFIRKLTIWSLWSVHTRREWSFKPQNLNFSIYLCHIKW